MSGSALPVAIDAMGGDKAPAEIVAGAQAGSKSQASPWCLSVVPPTSAISADLR